MYKECKFKKTDKNTWEFILNGLNYRLSNNTVISYEMEGRKSKGRATNNILETLKNNNVNEIKVYTPSMQLLTKLVDEYGLECKDYYVISIRHISYFLSGLNKKLGINDFKYLQFKNAYVIFDKHELDKLVLEK